MSEKNSWVAQFIFAYSCQGPVYRKALQSCSLTPFEYWILVILEKANSPVTARELAKQYTVRESVITKTCKTLRRLVQTTVERRSKSVVIDTTVEITEEGIQKLREAETSLSKCMRSTTNLNAEEREKLTELLAKLCPARMPPP